MKNRLSLLLPLLLILILTNCDTTEPVSQGVKGTIKVNGTPASKQVYIYPKVLTTQVEKEGHRITKIHSEPYKTITSNGDGFYETELKPGSYSIFVKHNGAFYGKGVSWTRDSQPGDAGWQSALLIYDNEVEIRDFPL